MGVPEMFSGTDRTSFRDAFSKYSQNAVGTHRFLPGGAHMIVAGDTARETPPRDCVAVGTVERGPWGGRGTALPERQAPGRFAPSTREDPRRRHPCHRRRQ